MRTAARFANDLALGRFLSADTVVPGAGNPQAYWKQGYAGEASLRLFELGFDRLPIHPLAESAVI